IRGPLDQSIHFRPLPQPRNSSRVRLRPDDHALGCPQRLHMAVVHLLIELIELTIQRHGLSSKVACRHCGAERSARILRDSPPVLDAQEVCYCAAFIISRCLEHREKNGTEEINRAGSELQHFFDARGYRRSITIPAWRERRRPVATIY